MFVLNGKPLTQPLTGVQRYFLELIKELDQIVPDNYVEIAVPDLLEINIYLKHIKIHIIGSHKGFLWEQWDLPLYIKKRRAIGVSLTNSAPLFSPDIVCIHDVNAIVNVRFYSLRFKILSWLRLFMYTCCSRQLLTVSYFSKNEIMRLYPNIKKDVIVIPPAWQHINNIVEDDLIIERLSLVKYEYFFALGSLSKNKNFNWLLQEATMYPRIQFVVSGGSNSRVFGKEALSITDIPQNIKFLGYATDSEIKALMTYCKAFVFPSFYEGFGLPPLEAMSVGAKIIISNIDAHREVYENAAYYIDPNSPNIELDTLLTEKLHQPSKSILEKYSWKRSAKELFGIMERMKID